MVALYLITRVFWGTIVIPELTAGQAGRDAWLSILGATIAALPLGFLVAKLAARHPGKTMVEYAAEVLGRPAAVVIGLFLTVYFGFLAASAARALGEAYSSVFMKLTPLAIFVLTTVAVAAVAARQGLEVLARASENVLILGIVFILLILVLPVKEMQLWHMLPVLEHGLAPVLKAGLTSLAFDAEVVSFGMVLPYLNRMSAAPRFILLAQLVGGLLVFLPCVTVVAIFGTQASNLLLPFLDQASMINIADFIQRIEIVPLTLWSLMAWLKVGFYLWLASLSLAQALRLSSYRPLVLPMAFAVGAVAVVLFTDVFDFLSFLAPGAFGVWGSTTMIGLVLLLMLASLIRGAGRQPAQRAGPGR